VCDRERLVINNDLSVIVGLALFRHLHTVTHVSIARSDLIIDRPVYQEISPIQGQIVGALLPHNRTAFNITERSWNFHSVES
jgi:hypothetical protein